MSWIIASLPFWMVGLFALGAMVYGVVKIGGNPDKCPEDAGLWRGVAVMFFVSAIALPIAAWLVS